MHKREDVHDKTLEYFEGDELATNVWIDKYALKNSAGDILELSPDYMHKRLTKELHRIECRYKNPMDGTEIYELLKDFKYVIPAGSSMNGIGNNNQIVSLSNCLAIGNESDSYGGICTTDEEQIQLMKRRSGVGHDLSHIRPKNSQVKNSALTSTGVVPFMERYSNSTKEVAQGGRRGALMLTIDIRHPDVEDFIDAKLEDGRVTNANISVKICDEFMKAVKKDDIFVKKFKDIFITIQAKKLWDKIIHNAWKSGEPGILFWDKIIKESPADCYPNFRTVSTNPCGELPLCEFDSCRLMSLNLYSYVTDPFTNLAMFDWNLFSSHVQKAQRLMDNIIDLELEKITAILNKIDSDPEPAQIKATEFLLWYKIFEKCAAGRRTGLGITALGDMLAALGFKYGTPDATVFEDRIFMVLSTNSYKSSIILAKERGCFPVWDISMESEHPFIKRITNKLSDEIKDDYHKSGRRNISNLAIAPTGSVSILTKTTSGIEPVFKCSYTRRRKVSKETENTTKDSNGDIWEQYEVLHPKFKIWSKITGKTDIKDSPYYEAEAEDVDVIGKIKMQGKVQKWIDHSISCTINLPNETKQEVVGDIYMEAWKAGCKGITVYRDGSRNNILSSNKQDEPRIIKANLIKRPKDLQCNIHQVMAMGESWVILVGMLGLNPFEVFAFKKGNLGLPNSADKGVISKIKKSTYNLIIGDLIFENIGNSTDTAEEIALTRLISRTLQLGQDMEIIYSDLNKNEGNILSFSKAIARTLRRYVKGEFIDNICPECKQNSLSFKEGCMLCVNCGYGKCG